MKTSEVLKLFDGNVTHAAAQLGFERQTIYNWIKKGVVTPEGTLAVLKWHRKKGIEVPAKWMP